MSAGWKKNTRSGKRSRRIVRRRETYPSVGAVMLRIQRDEDLAVGRRDDRGVAERQVDAAAGDADVVDDHLDLVGRDRLADHRLDLGVAAPRSPRCACRRGSARAGGTARRRRWGRSPCRAAGRCRATAPPARRSRRRRSARWSSAQASARAIGALEALEVAVEALVDGPDPAAVGRPGVRAGAGAPRPGAGSCTIVGTTVRERK